MSNWSKFERISVAIAIAMLILVIAQTAIAYLAWAGA